ncbi:hypothetical protein EV286_10859 [Rhizobium sp. BK251]|nr:hypothetical protein EV286_10859 [Rhizobium sp. BK251]
MRPAPFHDLVKSLGGLVNVAPQIENEWAGS